MYTTGRNEIQRCVFRFRTFNLNPSWILSQLSYERVLYIKSFVYASLFDCKNKIGKICTVRETINRTTRQGSNRPLACCPVYSFYNCTDFSNFIFAIKQGDLDKTFDVQHSLIAQLVQDLRMIQVESQKNHGQNVIFTS